MIKVGITGGIGSGKSIVSKILEAMNYPVYHSDKEAKRIINEDLIIRDELIQLFGEEVYTKEGLNRPFLANIIFNDKKALNKVNAIVHPRVRADFDSFCENQNSDIVFNEAAVLFETGGNTKFDRIVLVTADENLRYSRVMKRDGRGEDEVSARMSKQWPDSKKIPLADFVIENNETQLLIKQVEKMIKSFS